MLERYDFLKETTVIDAMRGIAALLVFVAHADGWHLVEIPKVVQYRGYLGEIGVYLFFILSGYLIWRSAERQLPREKGLFTYIVHRATRIMPLYYVALAFGVLIFGTISRFPVDISSYTVLRTVFFTQSLEPSVSRAINPVLWTLTHEVIFYTLVPVLFLGRRFFPAIIALTIAATWYGYTHDGVFAPFARVFFLFATGMFFAQYKLCPTRLMAEIAVFVALVLGFFPVNGVYVSLAWTIAIFSVALTLRSGRDGYSMRALALVGTFSYSLYIWHYMLIDIVGYYLEVHGFPQHFHPVAVGLSFTAFCLVFAWGSYILIEKPGQTRLRNAILEKFNPAPLPA